MDNKGIEINSLVIEVTRRCNMSCKHCLRGNKEDVDINVDELKKMLNKLNVKSIDCITFTGGEPTLNIPAIKEIISFTTDMTYAYWMATNGKENQKEISEIFQKEYIKRLENDEIESISEGSKFGIALSEDQYHDQKHDSWVKSLAFYDNCKNGNFDKKKNLINSGRAEDLCVSFKKSPRYYEIYIESGSDYITIDELYITSKNGIIFDCDFTYEIEDFNSLNIEDVIDLINEEVQCNE